MDDETEASGIFTYADSSAGVQNHKRLGAGADDESDIVSDYPDLDDGSVIVSDDDMVSGATSGVYTDQSDSSRPKKNDPSGKAATGGFDKLYDIENSLSDVNTNELVGNYGTNSHDNPFDDDSKNTPSYGQPIMTTPTEDSSPDRSPKKEYKIIRPPSSESGGRPSPLEEEGRSKLCGMPVSRVIVISACFVVAALIVVVALVVATGQDDDGGEARSDGLEDSADFTDFLSPAPTPSFSESPVSPTTQPDESQCQPDDDSTMFSVSGEQVNCQWLRSRDELFIKLVCEETDDVGLICSATCVCGLTAVPTASPTVSPSATPTSAAPTTSFPTPLDFTQSPTSSTNPPTLSPTASPTTTSPTASPTLQPTGSPTQFPTPEPTPRPTPDPTFAPSFSPTTSAPTSTPRTDLPTSRPTLTQPPTIFTPASPTEFPTTASPTQFQTRPLTDSPTAQPTITVNCEEDQPGTIPSSPPFWTCSWLGQTNASFRRNQCLEGMPAYEHCPTTCRSCAP